MTCNMEQLLVRDRLVANSHQGTSGRKRNKTGGSSCNGSKEALAAGRQDRAFRTVAKPSCTAIETKLTSFMYRKTNNQLNGTTYDYCGNAEVELKWK